MNLNVNIGKNGCLLWQGAKTEDGYGKVTVGGQSMLVHTWTWLCMTGKKKVPKGFRLHQTCRRRHCCNPLHVELVTARESTLRGQGPTAKNYRKTKCRKGHSLTDPHNVWIEHDPEGGQHRRCRKCLQLRQEQRKQAEHREPPKPKPSRIELAEHEGRPATHVALDYGVSDTTVRNWRKSYEL